MKNLKIVFTGGSGRFGKIFKNEPVPVNGEITLTDKPGFGAEFNDEVKLEEI